MNARRAIVGKIGGEGGSAKVEVAARPPRAKRTGPGTGLHIHYRPFSTAHVKYRHSLVRADTARDRE